MKIKLSTVISLIGLLLGIYGTIVLSASSPIQANQFGTTISAGGNIYQGLRTGMQFLMLGFILEGIGLLIEEFWPKVLKIG